MAFLGTAFRALKNVAYANWVVGPGAVLKGAGAVRSGIKAVSKGRLGRAAAVLPRGAAKLVGGVAWEGAKLGGKGVAKGLWYGALKGPVRRTIAAGLAGGIWGAATAEGGTPEDTMRGALGGALAGLGIGGALNLAFSKTGWRMAAGIGKRLPKAASVVGRNVGDLGLEVGKTVGNFMLNHPKASIGIGLAGIGAAYGLAAAQEPGEPSTAQMEADAMAMGGSSTGFAPGMGATTHHYNEFTNSTFGLVQGMHRGRHR